jgi:hypothetical protein
MPYAALAADGGEFPPIAAEADRQSGFRARLERWRLENYRR